MPKIARHIGAAIVCVPLLFGSMQSSAQQTDNPGGAGGFTPGSVSYQEPQNVLNATNAVNAANAVNATDAVNATNAVSAGRVDGQRTTPWEAGIKARQRSASPRNRPR